MSLIRLVLLLLILSGVTLFALQNWLPVLPLVILGAQTPALPLAVWMVGAIAAGALTTLVFAGLFKLSNTLAASFRRPARGSAGRIPDPSFTPPSTDWQSDPSSQPATNYATATAASSVDDDWEQTSRREEWDDWGDYVEPIDTPPVDRPRSSPQTVLQDDPPEREEWEDWDGYEEPKDRVSDAVEPDPVSEQRKIYEVSQEPKTRYQSGSVYSYSYRDPSNSGVGKTESVYDAEFRVIVPPFQPEADPPQPEVQDDDEDWGFEDDEEFDDRDRRNRASEDW